MPPQSLQCASHSFIVRIADSTRRNKAVDLTLGTPGFANTKWRQGAYITTLARNKGEALSYAALSAIGARVSAWPTNHGSQEAFDLWHSGEINALGKLVAAQSPQSFWSYGRAQKYINILLKYACAAFHSEQSHFATYKVNNPGLGTITPWLHAPVDSITLKHASRLSGGNKTWRYLAWSKALTPIDYTSIRSTLAAASGARSISPIHYEMIYIW